MKNGFVETRILEGAEGGALQGVRLAVKDNIQVKGLRFTAGHPLFAERRAPYMAPAVQRLLDAGAIVVGTTVTDAGGFGVTTPGVVNPIAHDIIMGGSSGGSAAAVASCQADIGLGTDTAGSIRIPAACSGLYAYKPSYDISLLARVWPLARTFDHLGLLARDFKLLMRASHILLGFSEPPQATRSPRDIRIGAEAASPAFRSEWAKQGLVRTVTRLRKLGYAIVPVDLPDRESAIDAHGVITLSEAARIYDGLKASERDLLGRAAIKALNAAEKISEAEHANARRILRHVRQAFSRLSGQADMIILPTLPARAPHLENKTIKIGNLELPVLRAMIYETSLLNMCGAPAASLPERPGTDVPPDPIPFSFQLIGTDNADLKFMSLCSGIVANLESDR